MRNILILIYLYPILFFAQATNNDCSNATNLCSNQSILSNNVGATVSACAGCSDGSSNAGNFCFSLDNTVWFTFTTNPSGGDANINIQNINCNNDPSYGNELQAVVIEAGTPCNESTYSAVSNCVNNSSTDFTLNATNLSPNTTYYILVDGSLNGNGVTNPSECHFNITTSGPAVDYNIDAGKDISIETGESTVLTGNAPDGFEWKPPNYLSNTNTLDPVSTPEETTTYYLSLTTADGCTYQDDVVVTVFEPITVPNTITINDDGINDTWEIGRIDNYPGAEVVVFDRWGQQVFKAIGYTNSRRWNGTHKGKKLPSGTYFYSIDLKSGSKKNIYTGSITLIY